MIKLGPPAQVSYSTHKLYGPLWRSFWEQIEVNDNYFDMHPFEEFDLFVTHKLVREKSVD